MRCHKRAVDDRHCLMCLYKQWKREILRVFPVIYDYRITFPVCFLAPFKRIYSHQCCCLYQRDFPGPKIKRKDFFLKTKHRASVTSACDYFISQFSVKLLSLLYNVLQNVSLNLNYKQLVSRFTLNLIL